MHSTGLKFTSGTTSRITVPDVAALQTTTPFSIIQVVYFTALSANRRMWSKCAAAGGAAQRHVIVNATGQFVGFQDHTVGTDSTFTTDAFARINQWSICAYTVDVTDGSRMFYGTLDTTPVQCTYAARAVNGSNPFQADTGGGGAGLVIGNVETTTLGPYDRSPDWILAEVLAFQKHLTLHDVQQWAASRTLPASPLFHYKVGQHGTGLQLDASAHGVHGTVTTATSVAASVPRWPSRRVA